MVDDELENLREKRRKELLAQSLKKDLGEKMQEKEFRNQQERQIKATMIINQVLEPDAQLYMEWLSKKNPTVAQTIKETIILILHKNLLNKPLTKVDIMRIERDLTGHEPAIMVKRRGREVTDLSSKMKQQKELNDK